MYVGALRTRPHPDLRKPRPGLAAMFAVSLQHSRGAQERQHSAGRRIQSPLVLGAIFGALTARLRWPGAPAIDWPSNAKRSLIETAAYVVAAAISVGTRRGRTASLHTHLKKTPSGSRPPCLVAGLRHLGAPDDGRPSISQTYCRPLKETTS
jgi:hypothetical protein